MNVPFIVLSVVLTLLVISGWVMLLLAPVLILTTSTVGGLVKGAGHLQRSLPVFTREVMRGILCIDGLASEPSLARRLRFDIASVLRLAPAGTRPRACACVKESGRLCRCAASVQHQGALPAARVRRHCSGRC